PTPTPDEEWMVLAAEDGREVGEHLVDLLCVGARGERRFLGTLELRRRHALHRPRDLLDVSRRLDPPADVSLTSHGVDLGDRCGSCLAALPPARARSRTSK